MTAIYIREVEPKYKRKKAPEGAIKEPLMGAGKVVELFKDMQDDSKEKMVVLCLDVGMKLLCYEVVAIGNVSGINIRKVEMLRAATVTNAYGIIMVHNHPSGNPTPSAADISFTKSFEPYCRDFGVILFDHIIIGDDNYYSFSEDKKITQY